MICGNSKCEHHDVTHDMEAPHGCKACDCKTFRYRRDSKPEIPRVTLDDIEKVTEKHARELVIRELSALIGNPANYAAQGHGAFRPTVIVERITQLRNGEALK